MTVIKFWEVSWEGGKRHRANSEATANAMAAHKLGGWNSKGSVSGPKEFRLFESPEEFDRHVQTQDQMQKEIQQLEARLKTLKSQIDD
jgi:hypothetical protein